MEHYATCPYQWDIFRRRLRRSTLDESIASFLVLNAGHVQDMIFHACHVYAVKRAADIRRKEERITREEQLSNLIFEGHRTAAIQVKSLTQMYSAIWT